ncbi:DNA sulfur modification protein DndB [Rhodococcus sp. RDE2]|uniref:DNA sulfur modification protein DndB n=1 Tax=Rhodococcus sp. RDE2 TaxID=2885078 RepID=UPI001E64B1F7|nr:DNA sulfur modification protein DndB [Rhodococcus sp. RDE2]
MDADLLDFNQLLQRDLDDHRVATKLIPYLLRPRATGPAFFPPIVAVLLPFKNKRPAELPTLGSEEYVPDPNGNWIQSTAGEAMRVRRLALREGELHPIPLGELHWNDAYTRLVVIDGQHRAMALLAIERTLTNTWDQSGGDRFKSFYEGPVRRELEQWKKKNDGELDLSRVEVPVAVCWFPDQTGPEGDPHGVARKLFVDVNKEARQPSESRLILLSDGELLKVLTRSLLNELRSGPSNEFLPLYAVEYDNPETKTTQSARWSVLTNIHLLQMAVDRCLFGPPKYLDKVNLAFGGRESETERDAFMRGQLELAKIFPGAIEDGDFTYLPGEIGNTNFPVGKKEEITARFMQSWGESILTLLSGVVHYRAHASALVQIKEQWAPGDVLARLAQDALFGGVGVYWTLRDSSEHFKQESTLPGVSASRTKPDIVKAWDFLQGKQESFERQRAKELLGSDSPDSISRSNHIYAMMNTHACQLGMMLTLGSLWKLHVENRSLDELPQFAKSLVKAWNAYFMQPTWFGKAHDRRRVMAKRGVRSPLNGIASLDTPQAVYFRYFWLEILSTEQAWVHVAEWINDRDKFQETLSSARAFYRRFLIRQQEKALKNSDPTMVESKRKAKAQKMVDESLSKALDVWFEISPDEYGDWKARAQDETVGGVEEENEETLSNDVAASLEDAMSSDVLEG